MNKKILVLIIFIILFFGAVTIYKFGNKKEETKEHYFVSSEIKNFKKDDEIDVNDMETYKDKIIINSMTWVEYSFISSDNNESVSGLIYISKDKTLHITDYNKNIDHKVSTNKFNTIYVKEYEYANGIYVNLIDEHNKVYLMSLESNDVRETTLMDYRYADEFTNFVDIEYKYDMYQPGNSIFALTANGKIYDINGALRYDERTISLFNSIYVFYDKTMTNIYGQLIEDKSGKRYKIKYIFEIIESKKFLDEDALYAIITEDDKFIYFNNDIAFVYEFDKKVKDVKFDQYYPYIDGKLNITFEDDYKVSFTARCNEYYCINEFAE